MYRQKYKDEFVKMGLESVSEYVEAIRGVDIEEFTGKYLCFFCKSLINSIKKGRTIIKMDSTSEEISQKWQEVIDHSFEFLAKASPVLMKKARDPGVKNIDRVSYFAFMAEYIKTLNEEESLRAVKPSDSVEIYLDGDRIDESFLNELC